MQPLEWFRSPPAVLRPRFPPTFPSLDRRLQHHSWFCVPLSTAVFGFRSERKLLSTTHANTSAVVVAMVVEAARRCGRPRLLACPQNSIGGGGRWSCLCEQVYFRLCGKRQHYLEKRKRVLRRSAILCTSKRQHPLFTCLKWDTRVSEAGSHSRGPLLLSTPQHGPAGRSGHERALVYVTQRWCLACRSLLHCGGVPGLLCTPATPTSSSQITTPVVSHDQQQSRTTDSNRICNSSRSGTKLILCAMKAVYVQHYVCLDCCRRRLETRDCGTHVPGTAKSTIVYGVPTEVAVLHTSLVDFFVELTDEGTDGGDWRQDTKAQP